MLYAYTVLLGASAALYLICPYVLLFAFLPLVFPLLTFRYHSTHLRLLLALSLGFFSFTMAYSRYHFPEEMGAKQGIADVKISSVKITKTPFGSLWSYTANLKSFIQKDQILARDIPIRISLPFEKDSLRPAANFRYQLRARLKTTTHGKYILSPIKNDSWHPIEKLYNLAEWRFYAKSSLQKHIQDSVQDNHVGAFLSGIATGEFDDRLLSFELSRFGLQHLMAISGLHFSILSTLLALILSLLFSRKISAIITMSLMSAYFIFLGASPSVTRAWIAILIGLMSFFIEKRYSSFNALGIATLIVIICDPLMIEEIGFQFSFGITAAILLWFPICEAFLQRLFAKRTLSEVTKMDNWDQHGYCFLYFLRQNIALCCSVNLVALPLTLYHFQSFPFMSLIYNLFFPFFVSFSLMFLVIACSISAIFPWLGSLLHRLNEYYTQFVLNFALYLPKSFDFSWQIKEIPKEALIIYLLIIFSTGIFFNHHFGKKNSDKWLVF